MQIDTTYLPSHAYDGSYIQRATYVGEKIFNYIIVNIFSLHTYVLSSVLLAPAFTVAHADTILIFVLSCFVLCLYNTYSGMHTYVLMVHTLMLSLAAWKCFSEMRLWRDNSEDASSKNWKEYLPKKQKGFAMSAGFLRTIVAEKRGLEIRLWIFQSSI